MNTVATLTELTGGLLYYSETEHPFTIAHWGVVPAGELAAKIAAFTQSREEQQQVVAPETFFAKMTRISDPGDEALVVNAAKARALFAFLQQQLQQLRVVRVEAGTEIPILITGYLPDGNCLVLHTRSVET
jgi:hypothetical protein